MGKAPPSLLLTEINEDFLIVFFYSAKSRTKFIYISSIFLDSSTTPSKTLKKRGGESGKIGGGQNHG